MSASEPWPCPHRSRTELRGRVRQERSAAGSPCAHQPSPNPCESRQSFSPARGGNPSVCVRRQSAEAEPLHQRVDAPGGFPLAQALVECRRFLDLVSQHFEIGSLSGGHRFPLRACRAWGEVLALLDLLDLLSLLFLHHPSWS